LFGFMPERNEFRHTAVMKHQHTVAIVVPGLSEGGGVPAVALFLREALRRSARYAPDLISIAVSSRDSVSVRLRSPRSWALGPQEGFGTWEGIAFKHIGSHFAEIEAARYLPRGRLTRLLDQYDMIQVVAGSPTFAYAITQVAKPKCLTVATTILQDRGSALAKERGVKKIWRAGMTTINVLLERAVLPRMDHVFAQSEYTQRQLEGLVARDRLAIAPPGVDTELFRPGTYQKDGYILSVGRFSDPRKNVRMLFKAYQLLRQMTSNAPALMLAGNSAPTAQDWSVARGLGIEESIRFVENPSAAQLAELYRQAAMFVLASDEEGFGIVIVEAMASGIPVISTRCGGPETIVVEGQTGELTPPGNYQAMAAGLRELLGNCARRKRMGEQGRFLAEKRFSIEAAGLAYTQTYDRLLASRSRPASAEVVALSRGKGT
jgi:glycosyltransferase involved in cell wall biosynthesis